MDRPIRDSDWVVVKSENELRGGMAIKTLVGRGKQAVVTIIRPQRAVYSYCPICKVVMGPSWSIVETYVGGGLCTGECLINGYLMRLRDDDYREETEARKEKENVNSD